MTVSSGLVHAREIRVGNNASMGTMTVAGGNVTGGAVVVTSTGMLRLDVPIDSVVSNMGVVQVTPNPYTFRGGFHNLGSFNVGGTQILYVQKGLANSGSMVLNSGGVLTADGFAGNRHEGTMFLHSGANLTVNSVWTNAGAVALEGGTIGGSAVQNADLVEGRGTITAPLANRAGGTVRASGGLLALSGATVQNLAGGTMEAVEGATLRISRDFTNAGTIDNRGGSVDFSSRTLTNSGILAGHGTFKAGTTYNLGTAIFNGGNAAMHGAYVNAEAHTTRVDHIVMNFHGAVTNDGYFKNTGSAITFFDVFYNNGTYWSDPATNTFLGGLSVGAAGALEGGVGDLFVIGGDLTVANPDGIRLADAGLLLSGGTTFTLAGPAEIGSLEVVGDGLLALVGGDVSVGLLGATPSQLSTAGTVYYDPELNPSLGGTTYSLDGGGTMLPIPEPGTVFLAALGALAARLARRRRAAAGSTKR